MRKSAYIDLFAGCGGLSLGLHNSGHWHGLFAIEKSPDAFATLQHNLIGTCQHFSWPDWLPETPHDIDCLLSEYGEHLSALRGKVELVVGGPPCQGFSLAGRRCESDDRNRMVQSYLKIIEAVRPKALLFENVKGFLVGFRGSNGDRGVPHSQLVLERLRQLGYRDVCCRLVRLSAFGVPQERTRCIIVGTTTGKAEQFYQSLPQIADSLLAEKGLQGPISLEDAISDLCRTHGTIPSPDSQGFMAGVYASKPQSAYQRSMRQNAPLTPDSHRFARHSPQLVKRFQAIIDERLSSRDVRERFGTRKSTTRLLLANERTPTLTTLPDDCVHYSEPRILTVREYARIQSFPDWYAIRGKYTTGGKARTKQTPRYSQIGNAVPPLFGEIAGHAIWKLLDG